MQREGALTKAWRPMISYFHQESVDKLASGESIYGASELDKAEAVLHAVSRACKGNPAVKHAEVALSMPRLHDFKVLKIGSERSDLKISVIAAKTGQAAKTLRATLLKNSQEDADTMGHIPYFSCPCELSEAMEDAGDEEGAVNVLEDTVKTMKKRDILESVIKKDRGSPEAPNLNSACTEHPESRFYVMD